MILDDYKLTILCIVTCDRGCSVSTGCTRFCNRLSFFYYVHLPWRIGIGMHRFQGVALENRDTGAQSTDCYLGE